MTIGIQTKPIYAIIEWVRELSLSKLLGKTGEEKAIKQSIVEVI